MTRGGHKATALLEGRAALSGQAFEADAFALARLGGGIGCDESGLFMAAPSVVWRVARPDFIAASRETTMYADFPLSRGSLRFEIAAASDETGQPGAFYI